MARFLMAWELGSGLGHAGRMAPLARELIARGHQVDAVLKDVVYAGSMFQGMPVRVFQAPLWMHRTLGLPQPQASLAEILLGAGYLSPDSLAALVQGWRAIIQATGAQAVIGDYAPTAVVAARIEGLPSASMGIGFYVPPDVAPLPPFRIWEPIAPGRVEHHDRQALDAINKVVTAQGGRPFDRLAPVFRGDRAWLCTWPELDHYGRSDQAGDRWLGPSLSPASGEDAAWPDGDGPQVFAYIRQGHPDHAAVLQALVRQGCRTLVYMPEVGAGAPPPVVSPLLRYSGGPVHLGQALSQARLLVCHAGAGVLNEALLRGVPVLMLPAQAEQFLIALRTQQTGAGLNAAQMKRPTDFDGAIRQLLAPTGAVDAARALAARYASFSHAGQMAELVSEAEALLRLADGDGAP